MGFVTPREAFALAARHHSWSKAETTYGRTERNMEQQIQDDQSPLCGMFISPLNLDHTPHVGYPPPPIHTTLLDLVRAVNEVTDDEQLVIATVVQLVNSGQARLIGTFKNARMITF